MGKGDRGIMKDLLKKQALIYINHAIKNYLSRDTRFFLCAEMSFELIGKTFLTGLHPSLIIKTDDFESLLQACKIGEFGNRSLTKIKTISGREVLKRCKKILPKLAPMENTLKDLIQLRNTLVHIGEIDNKDFDNKYRTFLRSVIIIGNAAGISNKELFGDFKEGVENFLDETKGEVEKIVNEKIMSAKINFENKFKDMDEYIKKKVIETIEHSYMLAKYEEELVECPACGHLGVLRGSYEYTWNRDDDFGASEPSVDVTMYPEEFQCGVCGLKLEGDDELEIVDLSDSIEMEGDPEDFSEYDYWD